MLEPKHLVSLDERLALIDAFAASKVRHVKLARAEAELLSRIRVPASANFVFLYGPSGVGKSTLIARIVEIVESDYSREMADVASFTPILPISAPASTSVFDWREFYREGLKALKEPLALNAKLRGRPQTINEAREAFIDSLQTHGTKVVVIDESGHIMTGVSDNRLETQLDVFKTISEKTGVLFVFAGTYQILKLRNLNAQLGRRSRDVHFERYTDQAVDYADFRDALAALLSKMPIPVEDGIVGHVEAFYLRTCGLIGRLKDWLTRALSEALIAGSELGYEHLEREMPSLLSLMVASTELEEADSLLTEHPGLELELRDKLGFGLSAAERAAVIEARQVPEVPAPKPAKKASRRVGVRQATRDRRGVPA